MTIGTAVETVGFSHKRRSDHLITMDVVDDLRSMTRRLAQWRLHELETASSSEVHELAKDMATKLLDGAMSLFGRVLQTVNRPCQSAGGSLEMLELSDDPGVFLEQVDRTVEAFSTSASADIAFIARLEMQSLARELESIDPGGDGWKIIELCERVRRHTVKATTALRRTLGQEMSLDLPGDQIYVTELVRSIQVRRRLMLFRRRAARAEQIHTSHLDLRLRLVGTNIAMLICRSEYRDFRIGDRMLIRDIQRAILHYLGQADKPPKAGERLWHDVMGAMEITRQVNRRPELLEHDHFVLESLARRLRTETVGRDDESIMDEAQTILGRDDVLDDLLAEGEPIDAQRWLRAIETALETLECHKAPESAAEQILEASSRSGVWTIPVA